MAVQSEMSSAQYSLRRWMVLLLGLMVALAVVVHCVTSRASHIEAVLKARVTKVLSNGDVPVRVSVSSREVTLSATSTREESLRMRRLAEAVWGVAWVHLDIELRTPRSRRAGPLPPPVRRHVVHFDHDSVVLGGVALATIREAARQLDAGPPGFTLAVDGHTDETGSIPYNKVLAQSRADAVAARLLLEGVARERMELAGYGELQPVMPGDDAVSYRANRRVEIYVIDWERR